MKTVDVDLWTKEKDQNTDQRLLTPKNILTGFIKRRTNADGMAVPTQPASAAVGVGDQANAQGDQSVCVGPRSQSLDREATAVGANSKAHVQGSTAVGESAEAEKRNSTVVGHHSKAAGLNTVHVGQGGSTSGDNATTVGQGNTVTGKRCTVVGKGNMVTHDDNVVIGNGGTSINAKVFQAGTHDSPLSQFWFGNGYSDASPIVVNFFATSGLGSNIAGSGFTISPGQGTGNAQPSIFNLTGTFPVASGSAAQGNYNRFQLNCYKDGLTAASVNALMSFAVPSNSGGGAFIRYTVIATDGTDYLAATGLVSVVLVMKGATPTSTITKINEQTAVSAGTISTAWTVASNQIKVNPTFTVVTPNSIVIQYMFEAFGTAQVSQL